MFPQKNSEQLMNELAERLVTPNLEPELSSETVSEGFSVPENPASQSLEQRLEALGQGLSYLEALDESRLLADLEKIQSQLLQQKATIEQYDDFQPYLAIKLPDGRGFLDLNAAEVEQLITQLSQAGDQSQADQLDNAYQSFLLVLGARADQLADYQQLQQYADVLMDALDWKRVQKTAVDQFPELQKHLPKLTEKIKHRLSTDPLASYVNKYVLLKEAIEAIGPDLFNRSEGSGTAAMALAVDNPVGLKKSAQALIDGKPRYQMDAIKRKDHKSISDDELRDIQLAMFEGRILT